MFRRNLIYLFVLMFWLLSCSSAEQQTGLPAPAALPAMTELPDPLLMLDSMTRVQDSDDWTTRRRPELKRLFRHYVYGFSPDAVDVVVIGAGIAGTATSYFLAQHGLRAVLCEKGRVSGEQENIPSRVSVNLSATANETSSRSLHFRHNFED